MYKNIAYIFILVIICCNCREDTEKRKRIECNLEFTLNCLQQGNAAIFQTFGGAVGTFEQAMAGIQATGGSKKDLEQVKECQDVVLNAYQKFSELNSLLLKIQNNDTIYDCQNLRSKFYAYRNFLCLQLLTKHPQNKPISIDFSKLNLHSEKDSLKFDNELNNLLEEVELKDAKAIREICLLLSYPEFVVRGEEIVPWSRANFENDLQFVNKLNIESIRMHLLLSSKIAFERIVLWIQIPKFDFNKQEIAVTSKNCIVKSGKPLVLDFEVIAYDSSEVAKIRYWLDDPKMKGEPFVFEGNEDCIINLSQQSAGEYILHGVMSQMHGETEKWYPWSYEYFIVE